MAIDTTIAIASGTLTFTGNAVDTQTCVIGGKTYTFQDTLTDSDGNVKIGASAAASIANLAAAIELGSGAGTAYAASMTRHPSVEVISYDATTLVVGCPGAVGNLIATTETLANASWGAATLENGSGNLVYYLRRIKEMNQINSEVIVLFRALTVEAD